MTEGEIPGHCLSAGWQDSPILMATHYSHFPDEKTEVTNFCRAIASQWLSPGKPHSKSPILSSVLLNYLDVPQFSLSALLCHAFYFSKHTICIPLEIALWRESLLMEAGCIPMKHFPSASGVMQSCTISLISVRSAPSWHSTKEFLVGRMVTAIHLHF